MRVMVGASIWAMGWNTIYASQAVETADEFSYDMATGGEQSANIVRESGGELFVTITEVDEPISDQTFRINRSLAVQNKTYVIKGSLPLLWEASYKISVKNQLITKVSEPSISAFAGTSSKRTLIRESSKKRARLEFKLTPYIGSERSGKLVATISDNKLIISQ
ncbi:DUF5626 family protein [Marinilactibacillus kalidii]|uniref:DUF5626 family protein n=1 Tax=Marinilactibacillus kalidii TaxID=2820274 RepID=UPI001ABE82DD|nr:DUF5626 family protein [Marinilactibacillus kalidii]